MKKVVAFMLIFMIVYSFGFRTYAVSDTKNEAENYTIEQGNFDFDAKSVVLMEAKTGEILYCKNENAPLPPASVTKIMTLLLVMEAISDGRISLDDKVIISANAASMGGSQVFLEEGEEMSVRELLKCTVISSANDAAVALSEHISGSEENFVDSMNKRAYQLGMKNTAFENVTGLDDTVTSHYTSAYDIGLMSRELIKHELILEFSSLWQDTIRDGEFTLTNTNRLVRYYEGCNGLKTGSTDKAGYCISATAKRDNMQLIAVVMGAPTRDMRNNIARALLDFGFSGYTLFSEEETLLQSVDVLGGNILCTDMYSGTFLKVINKAHKGKVEKVFEIPEFITAPLKAGDAVGYVLYYIDGKLLYKNNVYIKTDVEGLNYSSILSSFLRCCFTGRI